MESGALRLYLTESSRICQFFHVQTRQQIYLAMVTTVSILWITPDRK